MSKLLIALVLLQAGAALASPLMRSTTSWDGGDIAYPDGEPEITSVILRLEAGAVAPFHCHPVPTMGYVLRGRAEVETRDGNKRVVEAGDSVVEVMRTVHRGIALEAPVEIVVFYAGAKGVPVTVLPGDDPAGEYCDP